MVANLGQSVAALGIGPQDLGSAPEAVEAVEPLAHEPGALEGGAFGHERIPQLEACSSFGVSVCCCSTLSAWTWSL